MIAIRYGYRCPAKGGAAGSTSQATSGRAICGLWYAVCGMWSVAWSLTLDDFNRSTNIARTQMPLPATPTLNLGPVVKLTFWVTNCHFGLSVCKF